MNKLGVEDKIIFAVSHEGQGDGVPLVILGVPTGAWEYMKDGKTHTFDLTKAGVPVKLMLYGAASHQAAMDVIDGHFKQTGQPYLDERRTDFR